MRWGFLLLLFISFNSWSTTNMVVIGDSHTAGPFGRYLHQNLSKHSELNVALYGHSSSAAIHWMQDKKYVLSGGLQHRLTVDGNYYANPNPTHWRVKREVPKLKDILKELAFHTQWQQQVGTISPIDIVVVALGANDLRTVTNEDGTPARNYQARQKYVIKMLDFIEQAGAKCLWVGPPDGIKKTPQRQSTLYRYLKEAVGNRCPFYSSNHFKATACDGVHFNCRSLLPLAKKWAGEVTEFILQNL
jgi:hypothetical protein